MKQSRISAMEQADYSGWSLRTLRRLAAAFDLVLVVRFESFGTLLDGVTSMSREGLERPSFAEDPAFREGSSKTLSARDEEPSFERQGSPQGERRLQRGG